MKTFIKIIVVVTVIAGLILPFLNLHAQEVPPTKSETLQEVNNLVNDLANVKDDNTLSAADKEKEEVAIHREALSKILDLSALETSDLKDKLNSLDLENQDQKNIQGQFSDILTGYGNYYDGIKISLDGDLSLDDLKNMTKQFQDWRKDNYSQTVPLILNFVLVFNEKSALVVADSRLEKINSDLQRLQSAKLLKQNFQDLLDLSDNHLTHAHLFNQKAEDLILAVASSTLATTTLLDFSKQNNDAKKLVKDSLLEIKFAYQNFLDISRKVRQQLGL